MKSVLLSIKPKYCELIASGKKTVELRKTRPKIDTPFKVYIYCTGSDIHSALVVSSKKVTLCRCINYKKVIPSGGKFGNGKVIGEFVCDRIDKYGTEFTEDDSYYQDIGLLWKDEDYDYDVEEEYRVITSNDRDNPNDCYLYKESCLTFDEIKKYVGIGDKTFYGWHISELKIYDEPKELSEFAPYCEYYHDEECFAFAKNVGCDCKETDFNPDGTVNIYMCTRRLTRPPQSWCYVEELEADNEAIL